ncbi:MAG: hypothetical protein ABUK01_10575 [Leptospirales bacterium]
MFFNRIKFISFLLFAIALHTIAFVYLYLFTDILDFTQQGSPKQPELTFQIESPVESNKKQTKDKKSKEKQEKGKSGLAFDEQYGIDKKKWGDLIGRMEKSDNLGSFNKTFENLFPDIGRGNKFGKSYIYRKRHNYDLTVKDVFPTLKNIDKPFSEQIKKSRKVLRDYKKRNEIIEKYQEWKKGDLPTDRIEINLVKYPTSKSSIPLRFSAEQREKYFDATLPYSKDKQLEMFLQKYMTYHPDKGDLPIAVRELYYDNLQRILQAFSYDQTYMELDYFEEALNKEDFLKQSMFQVSKLNGTKTASELLFSIENIYEIQQNAWKYLFEFGKIYEQLSAEKKQTLRVETLRRIYKRYKPLADSKKITSSEDAVVIYSNKRLEIMNYLIENTPDGYRSYDAKFQKAKILWNRGYALKDEKYTDLAVQEFLKLIDQVGEYGSNVPDENDEKNKYNDFLREKALHLMLPLLQQYATGEGDRNSLIYGIQNIIINSDRDRMHKKMIREKELLWP